MIIQNYANNPKTGDVFSDFCPIFIYMSRECYPIVIFFTKTFALSTLFNTFAVDYKLNY